MKRVYVWELPVRIVHGVIFFGLLILSFTGVYIHWPFSSSLEMSSMRKIHFITGYLLLCAVLFRIYWGFAGNQYARFRNFLPLTGETRKNLWQSIRYYLFLRYRPPDDIGHNTLAGVAYAVLYLFFLLSFATGLVLYGFFDIPFLGAQTTRLIHYLCMYVFICFFVHHVYSAILWAILTKNGILWSIVSGYKYGKE